MRILGLTHPVGVDAAACLILDGKVVALYEEERFTRQKHALNCLPINAVSSYLAKYGINSTDLSSVAIGNTPPAREFALRSKVLSEWLGDLPALFAFHDERLKTFHRSYRYVDHHEAHALSMAPYLAGHEANLIVIDGWGGEGAGAIFHSDGTGCLKRILDIPIESSLGLFYQAITAHLGFIPHAQEGKTMALAAYAQPDSNLLPG